MAHPAIEKAKEAAEAVEWPAEAAPTTTAEAAAPARWPRDVAVIAAGVVVGIYLERLLSALVLWVLS